MREREHPAEQASPDRRKRWVAAGAGAGVLAVAVSLGIAAAAVGGSERAAAGTTTPATSTAPTTTSAPVTKTPAPETTPTVDADPAALADLDALAATLTEPIVLTTPAGWDQWLPGDKPYPGVDTADDLSTCPKLSDRLGASLGTKMSYWVGTLPSGPFGCQWATVPLYEGPDAPNYPYLASVGLVSDGSTSEKVSAGFYHHEGRLCPATPVTAAGEGTYLVRCEELDGISYALVLPDTRTSSVWVLYGMARSDAAHPATDVLRPVIDGAVAAFG